MKYFPFFAVIWYPNIRLKKSRIRKKKLLKMILEKILEKIYIREEKTEDGTFIFCKTWSDHLECRK